MLGMNVTGSTFQPSETTCNLWVLCKEKGLKCPFKTLSGYSVGWEAASLFSVKLIFDHISAFPSVVLFTTQTLYSLLSVFDLEL